MHRDHAGFAEPRAAGSWFLWRGRKSRITFLLVSGGGRYDANLSVHVADRGPHAKVEIMTQPNAPDTGAPFLTGMLRGRPAGRRRAALGRGRLAG